MNRVLEIWTSPDFTGTKSDALRLAMQSNATASDMFATETFDLVEQQPEPSNPDQLELEF